MKKTIGIALLLVMAGYGFGKGIAEPDGFAQAGAAPDGFVRIEGGAFTMGSPANEPGRYDDEGPQHTVTVSSFYMGKYEVTQREYQEVMGTNPSSFKGDVPAQAGNLPVESVSWYDAVEYCNKRSRREGLTPAYAIDKNRKDKNNGNEYDDIKWTVTWNRSANGYRLPTEAEWEYACRAGTTTAYNTGASITNNTGWYWENSAGSTHEVGQKSANAWGLYDMHGNVWEWCWDWYGKYASDTQTDPAGASSEPDRVRRGGSWVNPARIVRSASRLYSYPTYQYAYLGFRLARPARYGTPSRGVDEKIIKAWRIVNAIKTSNGARTLVRAARPAPYGAYPSGAQADPIGASSGSYRVVRGGSWFISAQYLRSAYRFNYIPTRRYINLGFRVVRSARYEAYPSGAQADQRGASSGSDRAARGGGWGDSAEGVRSAYRIGLTASGRGNFAGFRVVRS